MVDLTSNTGGIRSPNPFWLASAPPANSGDQVKRAFDAGWGGAVWKTLGVPIQNVTSRYGSLDYGGEGDGGLQQHRAHKRPPARRESQGDPRREAPLPEARRGHLPHGRDEEGVEGDHRA